MLSSVVDYRRSDRRWPHADHGKIWIYLYVEHPAHTCWVIRWAACHERMAFLGYAAGKRGWLDLPGGGVRDLAAQQEILQKKQVVAPPLKATYVVLLTTAHMYTDAVVPEQPRELSQTSLDIISWLMRMDTRAFSAADKLTLYKPMITEMNMGFV